MVVRKLGMLIAALLLTGPAVAADTLFALPIAPGEPGLGPWTIAVWPYEGCKDCPQTEAESAAFSAARDAIVSGDYSAVDMSVARIHVLPPRPVSPEDVSVSPAELHDLVKGCKVGAEGILKRSATHSGPGVSFGLGLDCSGDEKRRWMSLNFLEGRLVHVYYLPRDPIIVIAEDDGKG